MKFSRSDLKSYLGARENRPKIAIVAVCLIALILVICFATLNLLSQSYLEKARALVQKGNKAEALISLDQSLKFNSSSASAFDERGKVLASLGMYEKALSDFNKSLSLQKSPPVLLDRAGLYTSMGRFDLAVSDYGKALETSAQPASIRILRASVYCRQHRFDLAAEDYTRALSLKPDDAELLYDRAYCFGEMSDYDKVLKDINKALSLKDESKYRLRKGWCLQQQGHYEAAQAEFDCVIKGNPSNGEGYMYRGFLSLAQGRYKDALKDLEKARLLDSQDSRVYYGLAEAAEALGKKEKAIGYWRMVGDLSTDLRVQALTHQANLQSQENSEVTIKLLEQAVKINPTDSDLNMQLAKAYEAGGILKKAIASYSESIRLAPNAARGYALRGNLYSNLGQPLLAAEDFKEALKRDPKSYEAYYLRGLSELERHEYGPAESDFRAALSARPDSPEALQHLALVTAEARSDSDLQTLTVIQEKDTEKVPESLRLETNINKLLDSGYHEMIIGHEGSAIGVLADAIKKHPDDPRPRKYLAYAYMQKNMLEAAVDQFNIIEKMGYSNAADYVALANTYEAEDRIGDAVSALQKAVLKSPRDGKISKMLEDALHVFKAQNGRITIATKVGSIVAPDVISALRRANSVAQPEAAKEEQPQTPPPGADTSRPKFNG